MSSSQAQRAHHLATVVQRRADPSVRELIRPWLTALEEVPRHLFVPDVAWADPDQGPGRRIDRHLDPEDWLEAVYGDGPVITQRDDGSTDPGDPVGRPTCSLSAPSISLQFLARLDLSGHEKVLEIGTGTGWTAAALAWWLGDASRVISLEVDEDLAATAAKNLSAFGLSPAVVTADGMLGYPRAAPFDRVHVTCGVTTIPGAWLEQTRPGGLIALPWMPSPAQWGEQLILRVLGDGSATGRFAGDCGFMMLRAQRSPAWPQYGQAHTDSTTQVDPRGINQALPRGLLLALAAYAPHLVITSGGWDTIDGDDAWVMRLRQSGGTGWAICIALPGATDFQVVQGGDSRLWDELQAAYMQWLAHGSPDRTRYGITVQPNGHHRIWLDHPAQPLTG